MCRLPIPVTNRPSLTRADPPVHTRTATHGGAGACLGESVRGQPPEYGVAAASFAARQRWYDSGAPVTSISSDGIAALMSVYVTRRPNT